MKHALLFIFVFLVCVVSCKKEPDYSYPLEKYRELGMPDWNKAWTITDFGDVIGTLHNIKNTDPLSLPRKGSRKSGKLFEHIVSMDNLFFLKNDTLPLHEKAYRIRPYIHILNEFCNIYTDLSRKEQYYNEELINLFIFGISITQAMLDLAYQINESDDKVDISMQSGYPAIQYTYMATLSSALEKQRHFSLYHKKDLETLGDSIIHSIQRNKFWFDQTTADNIKEKMRMVIDSSSSEKINDEYRHLIDIL
jgi:hypothetical protein